MAHALSMVLERGRPLGWALVTLALLVGTSSCSSKSNPVPPSVVFEAGPGDDTGREAAVDGAVEAGTIDSAAATETSIGIVDSGSNGDVASVETSPIDAAGCRTDSGCWNCAPSVDEHFYNRCTNNQCAPFDNAARIPSSLWKSGALPPVP